MVDLGFDFEVVVIRKKSIQSCLFLTLGRHLRECKKPIKVPHFLHDPPYTCETFGVNFEDVHYVECQESDEDEPPEGKQDEPAEIGNNTRNNAGRLNSNSSNQRKLLNSSKTANTSNGNGNPDGSSDNNFNSTGSSTATTLSDIPPIDEEATRQSNPSLQKSASTATASQRNNTNGSGNASGSTGGGGGLSISGSQVNLSEKNNSGGLNITHVSKDYFRRALNREDKSSLINTRSRSTPSVSSGTKKNTQQPAGFSLFDATKQLMGNSSNTISKKEQSPSRNQNTARSPPRSPAQRKQSGGHSMSPTKSPNKKGNNTVRKRKFKARVLPNGRTTHDAWSPVNNRRQNQSDTRKCDDFWTRKVWPQMRHIVQVSLLACQGAIEPRKPSFQLFGYDFMLDEDMKVWLIEVNSSPAMDYSTPVSIGNRFFYARSWAFATLVPA